MGKFLKKLARGALAYGTGGISELANKDVTTKIGRETGLSPGKLPQDPYQSQNPYNGNVQWDESGMPVGPMPRGQYALDYQYEANRRAEQRRNALWGDAHNALRQGTDLFQSYRPGGSAALAANLYGNQASLYGTQAQTIEAPDLLMGYREHEKQMADRDRKQAEKFSRFMGLVQTGAQVAGAISGGGAPPLSLTYAPGGQQAPMGAQNAQGETMMGPGWGNPTPGQGGPGLAGGPNVPGGMMAPPMLQRPPDNGYDVGGMGQAFQQHYQMQRQGQQGGAGGAPGGGLPGHGGGTSAGGDRPGGGAGGQGMARGGMAPGGGGPVEFSSREAAQNAMAASPLANPVVAESWAEDPVRQKTTYLMMASARSRLLAAMA